MKKILFFSLLAGMALAGCTNDELVNDNAFGGDNDCIRFTYHSSNMTRAEKLQNTHYEFGVFANNGGTVMNNYLVAYGENALYNGFIGGATTYGDPTSQVDGLSYWFYESLGKTDGTYNKTIYNTPDNDQDLKFWDKSKENYTFWAYAPYTSTVDDYAGHNAVRVARSGDEFTFKGLSSFYTTPVTQIATANTAYADTKGFANAEYNNEMINYNEALYAKTTYNKGQYGTDVPFNFKHINAKVNLKFYSDVKGYNVEIIDAVPTTLPGTGTLTPTPARGIQLSPSTTLQSWTKMTTTQPKKLPLYYEKTGGVKVTTTTGSEAVTAVGNGNGKVSNNLVFELPGVTIGTTSASATASPTTLYVLPNHDGTNYITVDEGGSRATEDWMGDACTVGGVSTFNGGVASTHVADSTGYTLHLSYELIPTDGSASMKIYDARVFVPASACKWEAGKAYTYVFKITKNSNGTTDPKAEEDPATPGEPYVDVTDPRVPNTPALQPIVFDGVTVTDYEDVTVNPEFPITEMTLGQSLEEAFKNIKTIFSTGNTATSGKTIGQTIYDAAVTAGGTGTSANPYNFTLNTVTSDFIDYTDTDVNNNNVYKDLQALFQSLYNEDGIKELQYNGKTYSRSGSGSATPGLTPAVCWVKDGKSIESDIAHDLFTANNVYTTTGNMTTGAVTVVSNKPIEPALYFTLTAHNTLDETLAETGLKKAATQFVATSNYGKKGTLSLVENTEKNYTLTLKANDEDLMWPGYPTLDASTNTNDNKVYNDVLAFMNQIIPTSFASGTFGTTTSATLADNEHLAAAVATVGFGEAVSDFTNKPFVFNTNSNLEIGDLELDGGVTVKLVLFLNK